MEVEEILLECEERMDKTIEHLGKELFWDASPTEEDLGMEWRSPKSSLLDSVPPVLRRGWL